MCLFIFGLVVLLILVVLIWLFYLLIARCLFWLLFNLLVVVWTMLGKMCLLLFVARWFGYCSVALACLLIGWNWSCCSGCYVLGLWFGCFDFNLPLLMDSVRPLFDWFWRLPIGSHCGLLCFYGLIWFAFVWVYGCLCLGFALMPVCVCYVCGLCFSLVVWFDLLLFSDFGVAGCLTTLRLLYVVCLLLVLPDLGCFV